MDSPIILHVALMFVDSKLTALELVKLSDMKPRLEEVDVISFSGVLIVLGTSVVSYRTQINALLTPMYSRKHYVFRSDDGSWSM